MWDNNRFVISAPGGGIQIIPDAREKQLRGAIYAAQQTVTEARKDGWPEAALVDDIAAVLRAEDEYMEYVSCP